VKQQDPFAMTENQLIKAGVSGFTGMDIR